jgi:hypothetical protein
MEIRLPDSEPLEILGPAMQIVTQLTHNANLVSPLTHYITSLAACTLIELKMYESTREEAESGLKSLMESRIAPSAWDPSIRDMVLKKQNISPPTGAGSTIGAKTATSQLASQGLQHLADLATATEGGMTKTSGTEGRKEEKSNTDAQVFQRFHDLRELVRSGYMSILVGDTAR